MQVVCSVEGGNHSVCRDLNIYIPPTHPFKLKNMKLKLFKRKIFESEVVVLRLRRSRRVV